MDESNKHSGKRNRTGAGSAQRKADKHRSRMNERIASSYIQSRLAAFHDAFKLSADDYIEVFTSGIVHANICNVDIECDEYVTPVNFDLHIKDSSVAANVTIACDLVTAQSTVPVQGVTSEGYCAVEQTGDVVFQLDEVCEQAIYTEISEAVVSVSDELNSNTNFINQSEYHQATPIQLSFNHLELIDIHPHPSEFQIYWKDYLVVDESTVPSGVPVIFTPFECDKLLFLKVYSGYVLDLDIKYPDGFSIPSNCVCVSNRVETFSAFRHKEREKCLLFVLPPFERYKRFGFSRYSFDYIESYLRTIRGVRIRTKLMLPLVISLFCSHIKPLDVLAPYVRRKLGFSL